MCVCLCVFENKSYREIERNTMREIFHLLAYFPNCDQKEGKSLELHLDSPHGWQGPKHTWVSSDEFTGSLAEHPRFNPVFQYGVSGSRAPKTTGMSHTLTSRQS